MCLRFYSKKWHVISCREKNIKIPWNKCALNFKQTQPIITNSQYWLKVEQQREFCLKFKSLTVQKITSSDIFFKRIAFHFSSQVRLFRIFHNTVHSKVLICDKNKLYSSYLLRSNCSSVFSFYCSPNSACNMFLLAQIHFMKFTKKMKSDQCV